MTAKDRWHGFIHFLYEPALLGKKCVAVPGWRLPFHRIHLIPGSWLEHSCDRYDAYLETGAGERYEKAVNAPLSEKTIAEIRRRINDGTMPRRRVKKINEGEERKK